MRARYYDPQPRRLSPQDPLGYAGSGSNLYEYCGDDPTGYLDPSGEAPWYSWLASPSNKDVYLRPVPVFVDRYNVQVSGKAVQWRHPPARSCIEIIAEAAACLTPGYRLGPIPPPGSPPTNEPWLSSGGPTVSANQFLSLVFKCNPQTGAISLKSYSLTGTKKNGQAFAAISFSYQIESTHMLTVVVTTDAGVLNAASPIHDALIGRSAEHATARRLPGGSRQHLEQYQWGDRN